MKRSGMAVLVVLVILIAGLGAGAARAQVGPIQRVFLASAFNSTDFKQVEVPCPPGTIAFGGGASLAFGTNQDLPVIVHQSLPVGDPPTSWLALAQERTPTSTSWAMNAYALCAQVVGYELVEAESDFDSIDNRLVSADCPSGKVPIGGGGGIFFFQPDHALYSLSPSDTGWVAAARESSPIAASWVLAVRVSCAPGVDAVRVQGGTDNATEIRDELYLQCYPPRVVLGGGATVTTGQALYGSWPESDIRWQVAGRRVSGSSASTLIGHVLCVLSPLFLDGFESGDLGGWTGTGP